MITWAQLGDATLSGDSLTVAHPSDGLTSDRINPLFNLELSGVWRAAELKPRFHSGQP
jgi:hypothetical protein